MSRDSPLKSKYSTDHPSTKQLLDYNDKKRTVITSETRNRISKLPIDQQIKEYSKRVQNSHPKMFSNLMRHGMMSKEKQIEFDNYYNTALRSRMKLQHHGVPQLIRT